MIDVHNIKDLALFRIDGILFGIDIVHIQEINKNIQFTRIYDAQDYIKGVLNLRGQIVTVIDLRVKFKREDSPEGDANRRMIIVNNQDESVGFLVDDVDDIIQLDASKIEVSSMQMKGVNPEYFSGVYKLDTEVVIILDVEKILTDNDDYTAAA